MRQGQGNGMDEVYQRTTEPIQNSDSCCNLGYLRTHKGILKLLQVILSFVAFILEEIVQNCMHCHALYFFEFVSCSAFLLTFFLLFVLMTSLKSKLNRINWTRVDFFYTLVIGILFLIAAIVFAAKNDGSDLEKTSVAFGFLATIAFFVDLVLHVQQEGLPWKEKEDKPVETKKVEENVKAETQPLNEQGNIPV
ncbi:CKLF-like MARVEL transmembrane domain-containing protein 6 [Chiloscyllium plagiosum]|uniref:CKLF-like MARVEL transmembrane domain-containing protein 6 n=1 Tax=Chiloscyllium plagiosum TaxID=36176 RepID=UPI001CB7F93B|nr:CKLF-like MARVEL transmembrane domain-containing protein 6 [Chiloscyllium plagiosum]XP_043546177.1 CKLF-like MARVEL transmembrane domain-containing protein 6 [Chiloscyllium plagiosum]